MNTDIDIHQTVWQLSTQLTVEVAHFWGARDNNQVVIKTFLLMSYKKSHKYKHILFNLCLGIIDRFKDI